MFPTMTTNIQCLLLFCNKEKVVIIKSKQSSWKKNKEMWSSETEKYTVFYILKIGRGRGLG